MTVVSLVCGACSKSFERPAARYRGNQAKAAKNVYCSVPCRHDGLRRDTTVSGVCEFCAKPFTRRRQKRTDQAKVCSLECSARLAARKKASAKGTCACGGKKRTTAAQCRGCLESQWDALQERTLAELREGQSVYQFHAKVRGLARTAYRGPKSCAACGYDLHVDVCHVVPVADFPATATLREVNAPGNLVALDKRCHWEMDHGYLVLVEGRWVEVNR